MGDSEVVARKETARKEVILLVDDEQDHLHRSRSDFSRVRDTSACASTAAGKPCGS